MHQSDNDIRNRLLIARLPAMPQMLIRLIEHLQADDLGMQELAALVATDPGMTSKILTVANSSAYHRAGRTIGLEHSLITLGTDMIKLLVIGESVFQTFSNFPHSGSTDLRSFWKHALTAAVIARELATRMGYAQPEEAYLAGLLHNVGRLALLATAPQEYAFNFSARDDEDLCAVEQRTLQITHAEAGAWLIERWHLDSFLADAVLYHHEPSAKLADSHPLIRIVRVAHLLATHDAADAEVGAALSLCQLDQDAAEALSAAAARQVAKTAADLGIDLAGADQIMLPSAYAAVARDPVQQRLSDDVRSLVLVSEVGQAFARQQGESALLEAMARSARILFDFGNAIILLENASGHALVGSPNGAQHRIAEFSVALDKGGALADAALERRQVHIPGEAHQIGLAEQQLLRILGTEAMVCVPLVAGARCLGVLVGGVSHWQTQTLRKRERFMQSFGVQAANALETAMAGRGHTRRQLAHVAEEYREASRRVVHEVNNPLAIIKNYLSVLDDKLNRHEPVVGEMSILNEEIDRVGHLINGLTDVPQVDGARATSLARVVEDVLRLFHATGFVPPQVRLGSSMSTGCGDIECDADVLKQILVNLIKNAVEALPDGGKIDIADRNHVNRDHRLYVELVVSDDGPGLPPEVLASLFSAVRSTKDGEHRGLGLSIVHGLVTKIGGMITCRSGPAGTAFEMLLPVAASGLASVTFTSPAFDAASAQ
jgi:HD-like signal output (HDOD) protein/nitrogen-specific signal transduction histidine kinase